MSKLAANLRDAAFFGAKVAQPAGYSITEGHELAVTVSKIISAFLGLLGILAVILILYAGFLWMTSQGNEEQVTKAKSLIKNAIIGLVIIVMAYAISAFVINAVTSAG